jgi:murein L,D-transpeptidase YcbB/YkuD
LVFGCAAAALAVLAGAPAHAAEPNGPKALIGRAEIITIAVQNRLSDRAGRGEATGPRALLAFYSDPEQGLLFVDEKGLTPRAKSVMEEIERADDYGLKASDYSLPDPAGFDRDSSDAAEWLANAEIQIGMAVLNYAHDARGGRIEPQRLSPNLDPSLALPDPLQVMESIAIRADAAAYLRSFQPDQPQFEALRKALIAARGGKVEDDVVRIPDGPLLKPGIEDEQVTLVRKRLQIPASADGNDTLYDASVADAVRRFQEEKGVYPDGMVGPGTRRLLNGQQQATSSPARIRQILINMERWRWLPNNLGSFYVTVNIPEFTLRVMEEDKPIFVTRVVIGKPDTQTPVFSDEMETVVFGPYWNVPNSIKTNELLPAIRPGGDWFFGGGGGMYDASVFARNGLRVAIGTREVDPSRIDWSRVDIRSLNVYQPPGPTNVLGNVKFLFPNKHDVYMHDTTQKQYFSSTVRAESHGCVRVQNPDQFAALIMKRDQNWSGAQTASAFHNSNDRQVPLQESIPVYINYFTVWVNDDGSMSTFRDLYGHDARMAAALFGEPMPYEDEFPFQAAESFPVTAGPAVQQRRVRRTAPGRNSTIADVVSGFLNN